MGLHPNIRFKEGDVFLGSEPMITEMKERNLWEWDKHLPKFVESYIFEGVISPKRCAGTAAFAIPKPEKIDKNFSHIEKGFLLDGHRKRPPAFRVIEVKGKTLDDWLKEHETDGFMKSIDFFYSPAWNTVEILNEFTWCVKPKVILLSVADWKIPHLLEPLGYTVFKENSPFVALHNHES